MKNTVSAENLSPYSLRLAYLPPSLVLIGGLEKTEIGSRPAWHEAAPTADGQYFYTPS